MTYREVVENLAYIWCSSTELNVWDYRRSAEYEYKVQDIARRFKVDMSEFVWEVICTCPKMRERMEEYDEQHGGEQGWSRVKKWTLIV